MFVAFVLLIFASHYYAFSLYLKREGRKTEYLFRHIVFSYFVTGLIFGGISILSFFLYQILIANIELLNQSTLFDYIYFLTLSASVMYPLAMILKQKLQTPFLATFCIAAAPLVVAFVLIQAMEMYIS